MAKAKIIIPIIVAVAVVLAIGGVILLNGKTSQPSAVQSTNTPTSQAATNQAGTQPTKLADTQYQPYSYLISGDTISSQAQAALAGFERQVQTLPDGSQQIILKALMPQYHDQSYTVKTGEQLYFIETSWGDDRGTTGEYSLGDDAAVLVDQNGYIIGA